MKDDVYSMPVKNWDTIDLRPHEGECLGVSTDFNDDLIPVFVLPPDAPAKHEGHDLVFMLCSELCSFKLAEALAQGEPVIVE